jgi:tetratricopeptide (TPR) repeat protein
MDAASTYAILRQFPTALKLYNRALDVTPNDPEVMASKASIYQAQGNLPEAAKLLSGINEQTVNGDAFAIKIIQLRLERNYAEAVQLLRARQSQFHFLSDFEKAADQVHLAVMQRLVGDTADAKRTAEQARNAFEQLHRGQPDSAWIEQNLSLANAVLGEKDSALKEAERAVMLRPAVKDRWEGPGLEENLALIQTIFGEDRRAISALTLLLQTPYEAPYYGRTPATPALLRLDPLWDPLRADPAFQKLCQDKAK